MTGAEAGAIEDDVIGRPLEVVDDGEQLLWAVRPELTAALADLDERRRELAAQDWADTEKMSADAFDATSCLVLLGNLAVLAGQAFDEGLGLYTWRCV